jgi:hypothetical protein
MLQVGDIISNVFPTVQNRVDFKSFGHVVPPEAVTISGSLTNGTYCCSCVFVIVVQVLGLTVPCGPSGHPFQFSFANRNSPHLMSDLAQALIVIAESIPDGVCYAPHLNDTIDRVSSIPIFWQVVVFFQSYAYESQVYVAPVLFK